MSHTMQSHPLSGKVALVTGASRGVGKGIAVQLGAAGAIVYITARTLEAREGTLPGLGSLNETAQEIKRRGGRCIPVKVDHEKDNEILELFQQIGREQNNRLDILVNCAFKTVVNTIFTTLPFWEMKPEAWDDINNVGLRNNYICSVYAARMMVPAKQGLIINISSMGGKRYMFTVPYGCGKAAVDRMSKDCGIELKTNNITCLSLYPGVVKTELMADLIEKQHPKVKVGSCGMEMKLEDMYKNGETPEFTGKVIVALAQDPKLMSYNSQTVLVADYAQCHGIRDVDNRQIASVRQLWFLAQMMLPNQLQYMANLIPGFIKVPQFMLSAFNDRF